jgi:ATP-binding cassette subfamily B protein
MTVGLNMVFPFMLRMVIDRALPRHDKGLLGVLCLAMIGSGLASSLAFLAQGALVNRVGQRVVHQLRVDVYATVQRMPLSFFGEVPNTDIQARIVSDIGGISNIVTYSAQGLLSATVNLLAAIAAMLVLSWPLAIAAVVLAWSLSLVNRRFAARRRALADDQQARVEAMLGLIGEDLSLPGLLLGRTLGRSRRQRLAFTRVSEEIADLVWRQRLAGRTGYALVGATFACLPPILYWISGAFLPGLTIGTIMVIGVMQMRITGPIQQLMQLNADIQSSMAMFDRVFAFLDLEPELSAEEVDAPSTGTVGKVGTVRVRGLCYSYGSRVVLRGIDLDLPSGSTTVIVGASGSGKSTLALLLAGLLTAQQGRIECEGSPSMREVATLVPQETIAFNTTIAENLRFAAEDASDANLDHVAELALLRDLLERLPDGLESVVGEHGYQLSGGERQRLALARALLAPHPILILDEATSAIDGIGAQRLHEAVRMHRPHRTLVIIAHRIPHLNDDDQVVVLADGAIAERGPHKDLATAGGHYARLLAAQSTHGFDETSADERARLHSRSGAVVLDRQLGTAGRTP